MHLDQMCLGAILARLQHPREYKSPSRGFPISRSDGGLLAVGGTASTKFRRTNYRRGSSLDVIWITYAGATDHGQRKEQIRLLDIRPITRALPAPARTLYQKNGSGTRFDHRRPTPPRPFRTKHPPQKLMQSHTGCFQ